MISDVGALAALLVTLGIYSLPLWKDNPWYRIAEALFLGTSIGNVVVIGVFTLRSNTWIPLTQQGDWLLIFPIILSVLFYLRFTKSYRWLSRWPMAIVIAIPVAMVLRAGFTTLVKLTGISFVNRFLGLGPYTGGLGALDAILCLIAAVSSTVYFIYTIQRDNPILVQVRKVGLFMLLWYYAGQLSSAFLGYTGRNVSRWAYILRSLGIIS
jgi:hypothetical protein